MKNKIIVTVILFSLSLTGYSQKKGFDELMSQDWPNLAEYREANKEIISSSNYPAVVFMGNSIIKGWVKKDPEFFRINNYIGRGIGGQTTSQMLIRFTPDVVDLRPNVVVILAGTNDIAGNTGFASTKMITNNIKAMAQLAKANGIAVIFCSILPVDSYPWRPEVNPISKIAEINEWLKNYAKENGHAYLDFYSLVRNDKNGIQKQYSEDGVHPNSKGYAIMGPLTKNAIQQFLQDF